MEVGMDLWYYVAEAADVIFAIIGGILVCWLVKAAESVNE